MATSQFDSTLERRDCALLGMWAFLATELMFFGPLFFGYVHARISDPQGFVSGSHHMHIVLGTLNTAILLTSSFSMALGVHAAQTSRPARAWLVCTAVLGALFVGVKAYEWSTEFAEAARAAGGEARFYFLYFAMTGLHAIHLTIGVGAVSWLAVRAKRFSAAYHSPVEVTGLYWHFVDIVWVFLYPMFYLLERYR